MTYYRNVKIINIQCTNSTYPTGLIFNTLSDTVSITISGFSLTFSLAFLTLIKHATTIYGQECHGGAIKGV